MAIAAIVLAAPAGADDIVKMTIGQRGNWDTAVVHLGEKAGIFKKHGIQMEMSIPAGAAKRCSQSSPAGSTSASPSARSARWRLLRQGRADPNRRRTGDRCRRLLVRQEIPRIKTLKETNGQSIAYSTNGSSTHYVVHAFIKEYQTRR